MELLTLLPHIILTIVGISGFSLANYIYRCKHKVKPLVCPLRSNCDEVVRSKYSKLFGIPLEVLGMVYYGFVTVIHALMIFMPSLATNWELILGLVASSAAFLFSIYLTSIQAFVLKEWCTWCLTSATFCLIIFVTTYLSAPAGLFS